MPKVHWFPVFLKRLSKESCFIVRGSLARGLPRSAADRRNLMLKFVSLLTINYNDSFTTTDSV